MNCSTYFSETEPHFQTPPARPRLSSLCPEKTCKQVPVRVFRRRGRGFFFGFEDMESLQKCGRKMIFVLFQRCHPYDSWDSWACIFHCRGSWLCPMATSQVILQVIDYRYGSFPIGFPKWGYPQSPNPFIDGILPYFSMKPSNAWGTSIHGSRPNNWACHAP